MLKLLAGMLCEVKLPHVPYERNPALPVDDSNKDRPIFHFLEAYWAAQSIIQRKAIQDQSFLWPPPQGADAGPSTGLHCPLCVTLPFHSRRTC